MPSHIVKLGNFIVPDSRLIPNAINDMKKIIAIKEPEIGSLNLAHILGYKNNQTGVFYKRVSNLTVYGLLEGRSKFRITELGNEIPFPESEAHKKQMYRTAILNVPLWAALYDKYQNSPPDENFWVILKNITGVDAITAQKYQKEVREWYMEDIALISKAEVIDLFKPPNSYISEKTTTSEHKDMSTEQSDDGLMPIGFGKIKAILPKENTKEEWAKLKAVVDAYVNALPDS